MSTMNRLANSKNEYQGNTKRVLCLCSAGLLRSPTTAVILSQEPYNFNTRTAGIEKEFALIPVDNVLLTWAQEIVVMTKEHLEDVTKMLKKLNLETPIICLDIADSFVYRDPELIELIKKNYDKKSRLI